MQEFAEEIRKLKAVIVKHENRIRSLEGQVKTLSDNDSCSVPTSGGGDKKSSAVESDIDLQNMAIDEV